MHIGPRRAVPLVDADGVVGTGRHLVAHIRGESDQIVPDVGIHGQKRRVHDPDAQLFDGRDKEIPVAFPLEDGGE